MFPAPSSRVLRGIALLLVSGLCTGLFSEDPRGRQRERRYAHFDGVEHETTSLMVKFPKGATKRLKDRVGLMIDATYVDENQDGIDDRFAHIAGGQWVLFTFNRPDGDDHARNILHMLKGKNEIEAADLNYRIQASLTPNDPKYATLWAPAKVNAPAAWDLSTGSSNVVVGVVDSGIDYRHEDLAANMWVNPREIAGNGIDDDGNGYVDDVYGVNAVAGSGNPLDDFNHGSHCAGIIGAVGNNGKGVVGVNWVTRMMAIKVLNSSGSGSSSDIVEGINYAVSQKIAGVNLKVLSNSYNSSSASTAIRDAILAANAQGILFVVSAGNNGRNVDSTPIYSCEYMLDNMINVANTTSSDGLASDSNYGLETVHMGAPGSNILSTVRNNGYGTMSGTSMACPMVAGAAALMLARNGALSLPDLKAKLIQSGDPIAALSGKTISGRRLNLKAALDAAVPSSNTPPTASFTLSSSSGTTATSFAVDASGSSDAQTVTADLQVRWDWNGDGVWDTTWSTSKTAATTYAAAGTYTLRLAVKDPGGLEGTTSRTVTVTAEPTLVNLALNKTASASETYSTFTPNKAFDGSTGTGSYWAAPTTTLTQWLQVDLGSVQSVSRARVHWSTGTNFAKSYEIQYLSGSTWTTAWSTTAGTAGLREITFPAVSAQSWRIRATAKNGSYYTVYEFELFRS